MFKKILALSISFCLIFEQSGFAQVAGSMHIPGYMAGLMPSEIFNPVQLRAISFDPSSEKLSLFLDSGDTKAELAAKDTATASELYKYFQIALRLPNNLFWVNLRPDSPQDIIDPYLEQTDIGRILLAADLQLKKDLALFTSPDRPEGKRYWDKLYAKAESLYGQTDMEIPTFTRPWIVPGEIIIRESPDGAYIYKAGLQVMLEQDYLKDSPFFSITDPKQKEMNAYSSELLRAEILPKLTREVNSAKRYAALRQVYYSLVLAQWFKQKAQGQANPFSQAIDTKDLSGLTALTPWDKNTYYNAYKKSFSEGEYKKEEQVPTASGLVIRTYFSGGVKMDGGKSLTIAGRSNHRLNPQGMLGLTQPQVNTLWNNINFLLLQPDGRSPMTRSFRPEGNTLQRAAPLVPDKTISGALRNKALLHAIAVGILNNPDNALREQLLMELRLNAKDGGTTVEASLTATVLLTAAIVGVSFGLLFLRYGGRIPHSVVAKWMLSMFALMPILYSSFAFNVFDATILSNPAFSYLNIGSHGSVVPAPNVVELILNNKDGGDFEVTVADMEALLDPGSAASESLAKFMASDRVHFPNGIPYSLIQRVVEKCAAQSRIDQFWNQPADETRVHGLLVNFIKSHQRLFIEARNAREAEAAKDGGTLEEYIKISDQLLNAQDDAARAKAAQSLGLEGVVQVVGSHYALQKKSRLAWFVIQIVKKSLSQKKESSNEALLETITRVLDETDIANGRAPEKTTQEFDRIVLTLLGEYAKSSRDPIAVQSLLWVSLRPELDPSLRKQARDLREACGNALLLPPTSIRGHHLSLALKYLSIKTGSRFDSSGISKDSPSEQITALDSLLKNNPPANPLYTMPLKGVTVAGLGAADTPYASGLFIVLSGIDGSIGTTPYTAQGQTGIRYVLVNDMGYECGERDEQKINLIKEIERLKKAYPRVEFIQANQAVERLNAIVTQHDDAALKDGGIAQQTTNGDAWTPDIIAGVKALADIAIASLALERAQARAQGLSWDINWDRVRNRVDGTLNDETLATWAPNDSMAKPLAVPGVMKSLRSNQELYVDEVVDYLKSINIITKLSSATNYNGQWFADSFYQYSDRAKAVNSGISKDGGVNHGGIDFRALPLVTQPGMSPSMTQPVIDMKALQSLAQQSKMRDLDKEWARIEKQIAGKVMPYEKIKEYLAVCSDRKASGDQLSRVEQCLSNILKLEEACAVSTSAQMKELLLLVETVRT